MTSQYKPLPEEVQRICLVVQASPRLVAHLILVHDVACRLVVELQTAFPEVKLDANSVLFGAAIHDIGKTVCPEELVQSGNSHELKGVDLLHKIGISQHRARFAYTHANWHSTAIEDLLVALADKCWKGKRVQELEMEVTRAIACATGKEDWQVFATLDDLVQRIAADADQRLAWQSQFPATL
jgi:putative nucleotidyltransferase with HDIG domain